MDLSSYWRNSQVNTNSKDDDLNVRQKNDT